MTTMNSRMCCVSEQQLAGVGERDRPPQLHRGLHGVDVGGVGERRVVRLLPRPVHRGPGQQAAHQAGHHHQHSLIEMLLNTREVRIINKSYRINLV